MSQVRTSTEPGSRAGAGMGRVIRAWRALPPERRLAAYAAIGLFVTLFLPWYQREFFAVIGRKLQPASDSQTGWGAFSFVEAAVLLVAAGVLTLLFQRAEGRAFHLPGGDGWVITTAGLWTCVLIIWRIFDKQGGTAHGQTGTSYGIEWGIFVALGAAALLAYAGSRIRAAHRPEPPLPGDEDAPPPPPFGGRPVRAPRPVAADAPQRRSAATARRATDNRPVQAGGSGAPPDRPTPSRRRLTAEDVFEPVVPEDPPTLRISRQRASSAEQTQPLERPDEPGTIPLEEDEPPRG